MFKLDSIVDFEEEIREVEVCGETVAIRRLDGVDRLRLGQEKDAAKIYAFVLGVGLLDGETRKPIGSEAAYRLTRGNLRFAEGVFDAIVALTKETDAELDAALEDAKKNSCAATDSSITDSAVARDTVSIPGSLD